MAIRRSFLVSSLLLLSPAACVPWIPEIVPSSTGAGHRPQPTAPSNLNLGVYQKPNVLDSDAVDAQEVCPGYRLTGIQRSNRGLNATLELGGKACNIYGTDIQMLNLEVEYQTRDRLNVAIYPQRIPDGERSHYMLSEELAARPKYEGRQCAEADECRHSEELDIDNDLVFTYNSEPFEFTVARKSNTDDVLFSTAGTKLVFENQFIEFVTHVPAERHMYGLGETSSNFRLHNNFTRTLWASDNPNLIDENLYGHHPVMLATEYHNDTATGRFKSRSHGVYLRNGHGMDILLRPNNTDRVVWRTIGGSIDLFFYSGGETATPHNVIQSYIKSIGLPAMQQRWTLGYQHTRWGINNVSMMEEIVDNHRKHDIPLETVYLDIDYMDQYRDFTYDPERFPVRDFKRLLDKMHANGQKFIPILDAAIYVPNDSEDYETFTKGNASEVFLKRPDEEGGGVYIGLVWPGYTAFPDWLSPNAQNWWTENMQKWYDMGVHWDGMWCDMNEASSFCTGSCGSGRYEVNPVHPPFLLPGEEGAKILVYPEGFNITNPKEAAAAESAASSQSAMAATPTATAADIFERTRPTPGTRNLNQPPYVINHSLTNADLSVHAVSPNATHHGGVADYDVHNLYGHMTANATYHSLLQIHENKRPFVVTRSTFPGTGSVAAHWGGDNKSLFRSMALSIPQALSMSLYGIPFFGADTCGFDGNSDEELCNRWIMLSAFFPLYRNHNILGANSQEAYVWESVAAAARKAIGIRYSLLPYWYTLLYSAHTTGSTVLRALAWEFPDEPALATVDRQFMVGKNILVTPVLAPNQTSVKGIFPGVAEGTRWYEWETQTEVNVSANKNTTLEAPLGHIPVFVRGEAVLPLQAPGYTTEETSKGEWSLLVALGKEDEAGGEVYIDDGVHIKQNSTLFVEFLVANGTLSTKSRGEFVAEQPLANVTVMGVREKPSKVEFMGEQARFEYCEDSKVLRVTGLQNVTARGAWSRDWQLSWSSSCREGGCLTDDLPYTSGAEKTTPPLTSLLFCLVTILFCYL